MKPERSIRNLVSEVLGELERLNYSENTRNGYRRIYRRVIDFADIAEVRLGYLGKSSNLVNFYFLQLWLADGSDYPLFAPGRFYAGTSNRATVDAWRTRLIGMLAD